MKSQKVAIIGAGICGLYLAWKLSKKGFNVTLFERKKEIGKQACSGLFSNRILDFIPQSKKLIQNQIEYVILHFPKKTLKIKFSKNFFAMHHYELDRLVSDLTRAAGVKILFGHSVKSSSLVALKKEFSRIIGCDGALSQVRKGTCLKNPKVRLGIQGFITKEDFSNFVEVWATKYGFLWKIPRGQKVEYGIIEKTNRAKNIFDEFLKKRNIYLEEIKSALVPYGFIIPTDEQITLCGDAAGLTKPWSGGGVIWGLTAAESLLKNFPDFLKYKKELKKFFLPRMIFSELATRLVYFFGFNFPWILPKNYKIESDFLL